MENPAEKLVEPPPAPGVAAPAGPSGPGHGAPAEPGQPDLRELAAQIAQRHVHYPPGVDPATGRRPRGRPRKDGLPAGSVPRPKPDLVDGLAAADAAPAGGAARYVPDPDLVKRLAGAAIQGIEAWEQTQLYRRAVEVFGDPATARELAQRAGPPPGTAEVIGQALAEIAAKYDWLGQWTPEVALAVAALTWAGKDLLLFSDLAKRAAQKPNVDGEAKAKAA